MLSTIRATIVALCLASPMLAQAPDVVVSEIAPNGWSYYGQANGMAAYSFNAALCNTGDLPANWGPVVVENLYRLTDGGIQQIGASFASFLPCAVNLASCGACQATSCATLGIGCTDVSSQYDGRNGRGRWSINGNSGTWTSTPGPCCEPVQLEGRLFASAADLQDASSEFIAEAQILSAHDHSFGNMGNNATWVGVDMQDIIAPENEGMPAIGQPAIFAWQAQHPDVQIQTAILLDEGGPDLHGVLWVASRAEELGNGFWRYHYAVQNLTSQRGVASLTVSGLCALVSVQQAEFFGWQPHSGSPYDSNDWSFAQTGADLNWSTQPHVTHPNANALRWGSLYAFSFESRAIPAQGQLELGIFEPGGPMSLAVTGIVPSAEGFQYPSFCMAEVTSTGQAIQLLGSGSPIVATNDLLLTAVSVPPSNFGYFLLGTGQAFTPMPPGSQGNLCLGGSLFRLNTDVFFSDGTGVVSFALDNSQLPPGAVFGAGQTWSFQYWTRDFGQLSNFSNLAEITFCQ